MRSRWLLLCLCAFGAAWIVAAAASNFGVRGFAYGWYDVDTFATTQPYVVRFDSPQPDGAGARAGIRAGDLLDLREQPAEVRWWLAFQPIAGRPITLQLRRDAKPLSIAIVPSTVWDGDWRLKILTILVQTLSSVWFVGCATILVLRRASLREARILALILLSMGLSNNYFTLPSAQAAGAICMFSQIVCYDIAWILLVILGSGFGARTMARRIFETVAYAFVGLQLIGITAFSYGLQTLKIDPMLFGQNNFALGVEWTTAINTVVAAAITGVVIWAVAVTPKAERARAAWLLLPVSIAMLSFTAFNTIGLDLVHFWSATQASILLGTVCNIAGALAVTYALLRRRVLDLGFFLSRTIVVATISLIVVAAFVLLEWMLGNVVAGVSHTTGIVANAALALVLGLSLHFIHQRVDLAVDSIFFRKRHEDERQLRDYAKEAAFVTDVPVLLDQTIVRLERHTDARGAAILVDGAGVFTAARSYGDSQRVPVSENDEAILALKAWHRPLDPHHYRTDLQGALALPMLARGRLLGVLLLDERTGGESYAPDEVEALSTLAQGVGSSLDALTVSGSSANALLGLTDAINRLREDISQRLPAPTPFSEDASFHSA
jgi:hypothetical protein